VVEIVDSARKHGISDDDIIHAVRHQIRAIRPSVDRMFLIGADRNGQLLEIVMLDATDEDPPCVIHAMKLRPKFYPTL
jgi:hypothetical protein